MVGTTEFEEGDTLNHSTYGKVTIRCVTEELDEFMVTDTGEKSVFEGGSIRKVSVNLEKEDGVIIQESMEDFIEEVH